MYDIKWIREHPELFKAGLRSRRLDAEKIYDELVQLDKDRREFQTQSQQSKAEINRISAEIGAAKRAGDNSRAAELMEQVSRLKSDVTRAAEKTGEHAADDLEKKLLEIPNLP